MKSARTTWVQKVRRLLGERDGDLPRGAVADLARRLGVGARSVHNWIEAGMRPRNESTVVQDVATALGVDDHWLIDGTDSAPIRRGEGIPADVAAALPARFKRLVYAASDPRCAEFLLSMLDVYERTMRPTPGSGRA